MYKNTFKMINGDIVIENNDLVLVTGQEELRQNIENRLSVNKGEWFLNTDLGLQYSDIQGKGVTDGEIDFAIRECCYQDDRVQETRIRSIERNSKTRNANINIIVIDKDENETGLQEVINSE